MTTRLGMHHLTCFPRFLEKHSEPLHMLLRHNLFRMQQSFRVSPAIATVVSDTLQDKELVVGLIGARARKA